MATYKKQLVDKDGNIIIPDVGINLDDVVYSDDPTEVVTDIIDPNSYSTEEKWTGGYWIDNKKIYKKTIEFGTLPNNNSKSTNHGISNISEVVKIEAIAIASGAYFLVPQATPVALTYQCSLSVSNTVATIRTGTDYSGYSGYITLYYTKTS